MDEDERFSASSPESERENEPEPDQVMADEPDNEPEENNDDDEEDDDDNDGDQDDGADATQGSKAGTSEVKKSSTPGPQVALPLRPTVRPEYVEARLYDIVPTMAAPQSTSVNAMSITPDLRYWITGGSDGYIRKYDGPGTINGKLPLTVAQRHPFVDSVTKAGILMSYWENDEPAAPGQTNHEQILSPVYSLAVESSALWLLSGLESGAINLQSVRHDEGKKIHSLQRHTNAVSVLTMAQDERSVLSGSWDKSILDWDLNTGQTIRSFTGTAGQISSIELRPECGDPVPADADEELPSTTMSTNNGAPFTNGNSGVNGTKPGNHEPDANFGEGEGEGEGGASPAHESLFGGSDAGSLFGETAGEQPFGQDYDEYGTGMGMMTEQEGGMDHSADMAMAGMDMGKDPEKEPAPAVQPPSGDAMDVDTAPVKAEERKPSEPKEEPPETTAEPPTEQTSSQPLTQTDTLPGTETTEAATTQPLRSPTMIVSEPPRKQHDPSQTSTTTFLSSAMDGTIRLWDRRVPNPVARILPRAGVPPWCMSACWSPDGNMIYAGRRNGTVEEFDVRKAKRGWEPERILKFPGGSGAVSAVKPMVNGRHLVW